MDVPTRGLVTLVNPIGQTQAEKISLAQRLSTLNDRTVGLINTGKPSIEHFLEETERQLRAQFPGVRIVNFRKDFTSAKPIAQEVDGKVQAAISAWGD